MKIVDRLFLTTENKNGQPSVVCWLSCDLVNDDRILYNVGFLGEASS